MYGFYVDFDEYVILVLILVSYFWGKIMFVLVVENEDFEWFNVVCVWGRFWWYDMSGSNRFFLVYL